MTGRDDPADPTTPPRVFVSYSHDSAEHEGDVLRLCHLLRGQGVDARLDSYDVDERRDWYVWYVDQVRRADFVVVIASPGYRAAGDGQAAPDRNRGVQSEAALLRDLLHDNRVIWTRKILPVVLPGRSIAEIPLFAQPSFATRYVIMEISASGIEDLLRTITGQPAHPAPALGEIPELPPRDLPATGDVARESGGMRAYASDQARIYQAGRDQYIGYGNDG